MEKVTKTLQKDIEGYVGKYKITENGDVLSVRNKLKILTPYITKQGFKQVSLSKNNENVRYLVSHLVGKAFLPDYPKTGKKPKLIHINGIKSDDRKDNLKLKVFRPVHSSKYKGVTWNNASQKWVATMIVNGVKNELGRFEKELEASHCYEKALKKKKLKTEFSQMNKKLKQNEKKQLELEN